MKNKNRASALLLTLMLVVSLTLSNCVAFAEPAGLRVQVGQALEVASESAVSSKDAEQPNEEPEKPAAENPPEAEKPAPEKTVEEKPRAEITETPATEKPEPTEAPATEKPADEVPETAKPDSETEQTETPSTQKPESTEQPGSEAVGEPITGAEKLLVDDKAVNFVVEFYASVNGVRKTEIAADPITVKKGSKININNINPRREINVDGQTYHLNPQKWDLSTTSGLSKVNKDMKVYATYDTAFIENANLGYSGKQGDSLNINIPIAYLAGDKVLSNKRVGGGQITEYAEGILPSEFDQTFVSATGITEMRMRLDDKYSLFSLGSKRVADGNEYMRSIVLKLGEIKTEEREGLAQTLTESDPVNKGLATFPLTIASKAKAGTYDVPFILNWKDGTGDHSTEVYVKIKVAKKASSSGGGGGGGIGSSEPKQLPQPRVYIDNVRTEPADPKAGDEFEMLLTIVNTSKTQYLQNMQLNWSAADDVLMPAGEKTNVLYIEKIKADAQYEVRIPVQSLPELPNKLVKVDVAMEFEDSKMAEKSESQSLTVTVLPVMRVKIDDPKMPSSSPISGEDMTFTIPITNSGKTALHNVTARVVTTNDDLMTGPDANLGTIEPGASKSGELEVTPLEAGSYDAQIEITYENESGEKAEPQLKPLKFSAIEMDDNDYDPYDSEMWPEETPAPAAPSAQAIMSMLPSWLYIGVGALLLLLIVSMAVGARRRRRRAMEDDEME